MKHSNTKSRSYAHLSAEKRGIIQAMHHEGHKQKEIANAIGVNQSTISRELKRGKTRQMIYDHQYIDVYLAETGSRVYKENRLNSKARGALFGKSTFIKAFEEALLTPKKDRVFSVDTFIHKYRREHPLEIVPCTKTMYKYINLGLLRVKNIDLPMKTRIRPRKQSSEPRGINKKLFGKSIDQRCPDVLFREEFGHWELDLVIGKKTKGEPCIITLVERKTRKLLTKKTWRWDAGSIVKSIKRMILKEGQACFKTLTTDNGSEFSKLSHLEYALKNLEVFFAHAYSAWEKGSNERHNRMLREYLPKGTSFKKLTYQELAHYTNTINNRFRKILDYQTPNDCYNMEVAKLQETLREAG
ncbi:MULTISPECIES: IS30 family transposase [Aerococcus]|uniref:IS30 family transposase n=1 Tax=Aerococcus loyolae TaxID=2976809 RepID=A0ABT4C1K6_9LACT|nr:MULTISPECIES: IS30 family transposase [Aerococcus]KAA9218304.1 IS30 family transposase [Aerococcus loyolae]KAA9263929.1 IS30 family transposase [Aerococcus loyolae]MCY3026377.1 IS30 family transposase [Aerococcus loyolae]MCY3027887.1 IS30 family transposase [Aerococcus loyolae]MCY3029857.1 IS30 family transposase [Aerococcus loyolae]